MKNHTYSKEDYKFLEGFKNTTLDISNFHHKEHILITYVLLIDNSVEETQEYIKKGILNILKKVNADLSKYHETMTYAWIKTVEYFMQKNEATKNFDEFISLNLELLDINILYKHYSEDLIKTKKARDYIVEPDIKSFNLE